MGYSFIKPKRKPKIDSESRMILLFGAVTALLIFGFTAYILLKKSSMQGEIVSMRAKT